MDFWLSFVLIFVVYYKIILYMENNMKMDKF